MRIFDLVLASHPLLIIHLCVSIIVEYKEEIVEGAEEYQSSICYVIFHSLSKLNNEDTVE